MAPATNYVYFVAFDVYQDKTRTGGGNWEVHRNLPIDSFGEVNGLQDFIAKDKKIPRGATVLVTNWILLRTEGTGPEKC